MVCTGQVTEEKRRISAAAAEARARRMGGGSTAPAASSGQPAARVCVCARASVRRHVAVNTDLCIVKTRCMVRSEGGATRRMSNVWEDSLCVPSRAVWNMHRGV